jgi:dephospho-CoA kinase
LACNVKLLGLTGGIGMGKSAAGHWLERHGLQVVDSDVVARDVCAPGTAALAAIRERFGTEVIASDGSLRRDEMARRVFGDEEARKALEAILHPRIRSVWKAETQRWRGEGRIAGAVQIPLLFETAAENEFDAVICLACSAEIQKARLLGRGWDEAQIAGRIGTQLPIEEKIDRSDFVVWNESGLDELGEQLERILQELGIAPD